MNKVVLGVFTDQFDVENTVNELEQLGIDASEISIIMHDKQSARVFADDTGADVAEGAVSGAATGGALGALAGLLSATVIPGIGAFLIGGPIAAALGLTGAAAGALSGAATGVLAGGLIGGLIGLGLSDEDAEVYEEHIRSGRTLVAVPVDERMEDDVRQIFVERNAQNIKSVDFPEKRKKKRIRTNDDEYMYPAMGAKGGKSRWD